MDKISYALGMRIAETLVESGVKEISIEDFKSGLLAMVSDTEPEINKDEANDLLNEYFAGIQKEMEDKREKLGQQQKKEGEDYMEKNTNDENVVTTESGLQYKVIKEGTGKKPAVHNRVKCHYTGTLINGQKFDSSYDRNQPALFGLNQVIAGWTEGLQLMSEGSVYEFTIPYQLAYGTNGIPGVIPPYATLIFKVELLEVL